MRDEDTRRFPRRNQFQLVYEWTFDTFQSERIDTIDSAYKAWYTPHPKWSNNITRSHEQTIFVTRISLIDSTLKGHESPYHRMRGKHARNMIRLTIRSVITLDARMRVKR